MKKSNSYRIFSGFLLILISVVFIIFSVVVSWVLRDGLGPDAFDSHGLVAFQRFLESLGPMLLFASPIGLTGLWLASPILLQNNRDRGARK
jgi:hypothetical protein